MDAKPADPLLPVLYINLDRAPGRRRNIEQQVTQHLPGHPVHRIAAEDSKLWTEADRAALAVTPRARYFLAFPQNALGMAEFEGWGACGCYLSHMKCWRWMCATRTPVALILEDDACFKPEFAAAWRRDVVALLRHPEDWDALMLGFTYVHGTRHVTRQGVTLQEFTAQGKGMFFFAHAYLLTQRGAQTLLRTALPMEVQVDHYMLLLAETQRLRLFLLGTDEIVRQCAGSIEQSVEHSHRRPQDPPVCRQSCLRTNLMLGAGFLVLLLCATLVVVAVWLRPTGRSGDGTAGTPGR